MKSHLAAALLVLVPASASAMDSGNLPAPYTEIAAGASFIPAISTKTYTLTDGVDTATGRIQLDYNTALTVGAEFGVAGVGSPQLRLAVSYEYLQARFDSGVVVGTVNGVPGSFSFSRSDLAGFGVSLDNDVHLVSGNVSYDLPELGPFTPYVGGGVGAAFIQNANTQLALTATAGLRLPIDDNIYVGLRYRFYHISGPTDDFGIQYDAIMNHSIMVLFGVLG